MVDLTWSQDANNSFSVVGVASSAGGPGALAVLLGDLPPDFPAAVLLVQHRPPVGPNRLIEVLARSTRLRVVEAAENDAPVGGTVFVPPPGRHLEINDRGRLSVARSGRVAFVCPSADMLFSSMAERFQRQAIAVVLTGRGQDGAKGVAAVRRNGGFVIAQDRQTSTHFDMPCAAIETRAVDIVLPVDRIGVALQVLTEGVDPIDTAKN